MGGRGVAFMGVILRRECSRAREENPDPERVAVSPSGAVLGRGWRHGLFTRPCKGLAGPAGGGDRFPGSCPTVSARALPIGRGAATGVF